MRVVGQQEELEQVDDHVRANVPLLPVGYIRIVTVLGSGHVGLGNVADQAESGLAWRPTWSLQQSRHLIAEALHSVEFGPHVTIVTELKSQLIKGLCGGRHHTKHYLLLFSLIRAEDSVPDHDQSAIVLVNAVRVLAVMDAVLAGSVHYVFDRSQMPDN